MITYYINKTMESVVIAHIQYNPGYNDHFCPAVEYRYNQFIVITKIEIYYIIHDSAVC